MTRVRRLIGLLAVIAGGVIAPLIADADGHAATGVRALLLGKGHPEAPFRLQPRDAAATPTAAAAADGASLLWHLDSQSADRTPDESGNGFDGTVTEAPAVSDGRFAGAFRIPQHGGAGIVGPRDAALEQPHITVLTWLRHDGAGTGAVAAYGQRSTGVGGNCRSTWIIAADGASGLSFTATGADGVTTAPPIPVERVFNGQWHAVAFSYDGTRARAFVDGEEVDGDPPATPPGPLKYAPLTRGLNLGSPPEPCTPSPTPDVDVDEVRMYPDALDVDDLRYLTNPFHVMPPRRPQHAFYEAGLAARYDLDGKVDTERVLDSSGHGLHGEAGGGAVIANGRFGSAFDFGADDGEIDIRNSRLLEPETLTLVGWARRNGVGRPNRLIVGKDGVPSDCTSTYGFDTDADGNLRFSLRTPYADHPYHTPAKAAAAMWDGQWHAMAGTYENRTITLWVDGVKVGSQPVVADDLAIHYGSTFDGLYIGGLPICESTDFDGAVDEVRVYRRALTDEEIAFLQDPAATTPPELPESDPTPEPTVTTTPEPSATPTETPTSTPTPEPTATGTPLPTPTAEPEPGLALKWHLEGREEFEGEPYDGKVFDASGGGHHGTVSEGVFVAPGRFGRALRLPTQSLSSSVGVAAPADPALQPATVTVLAWARGGSEEGTHYIATYGQNGCDTGTFALLQSGDIAYFDARAGDNRRVVGSSGPVPFDGQWHALAGVFDGSGLALYVDGILAGRNNGYGVLDYSQLTSTGLRAGDGTASGCPAHAFHGSIDEVRVYDHALSPDEIAYLGAGWHRNPPTLPIPDGPRNSLRPSLSGTPRIGAPLTCNPGLWSGHPTFEYLWERAPRETQSDGDGAWAAIDGATGPTYTPTQSDLANGVIGDEGSRVRCRVIATEAALTGEAVSKSLRVDFDVPSNTKPPAIELVAPNTVPRSGEPLVCNPGEWTNGPDPADFTYSWQRDGRTLAGETGRSYTPKPNVLDPISGQITQDGEGNADFTCTVAAANDVGASAAALSPARFVVNSVPRAVSPPVATIGPATDGNDENYLQRTAHCTPGTWKDAYAAHPQTSAPGYDFEYRWMRAGASDNGTPVAGATGPDLQITADMLGRNLYCLVYASNPLGTDHELYNASNTLRIPLPTVTKPATFASVFRDNPNDPVNVTAVDPEFRAVADKYGKADFERARQVQTDACVQSKANIDAQLARINATGNKGKSPFPDDYPTLYDFLVDVMPQDGVPLDKLVDKRGPPARSIVTRCAILRRAPESVVVRGSGVKWNRDNVRVRPCDEAVQHYCEDMGIAIQPLDPTAAPSTTSAIDLADREVLDRTTPVQTLWDLDGDQRTDISCPGASPVMRGLLKEGTYPITAIIVEKQSEATGIYAGVTSSISVPNASYTQVMTRKLNPDLPKWCRTSMVPPPDPKVGPCAGSATIGPVQLTGNMCPINVRGVPDAQIKALPERMQEVIRKASDVINKLEMQRDLLLPGSTVGTRRQASNLAGSPFVTRATSAVAASLNNAAATWGNIDLAQFYATSKLGSPLDQALDEAFDRGQRLLTDQSAKALDQIYAVNKAGSFGANGVGGEVGPLKVNGVTVSPTGTLHTIIAPSDAGDGIAKLTTPKMEIFSPEAQSSLGGVPLSGAKDQINQFVSDVRGGGDAILQDGIDYTKQKFARYAEKLNFGPFKLVGNNVKVKLNDDGTAQIDGVARLPGLTNAVAPPGGTGKKGDPIQIGVTLKGNQNGDLQLQGLKLKIPKAFLIAVQLEKLDLTYTAGKGLDVTGLITFPLSGGNGIQVKNFRLGPDGEFLGTDVAYKAGAGAGLLVAPGVYLTKIGGGFSAKPFEINAQAAVSAIAPSVGGGCPTIGIDGGVTFHFSPRPVFMRVKGEVQLVCIGIGDFDFYADESGVITAGASAHLEVPAIVSLQAALNGQLKVDPNQWQIDMSGEADFDYLPFPDLSLTGVVGSLGVAACAGVRIKTPFKTIRLRAGAGIAFPGGRPPLSQVELIANFRAFLGCDLSAYTPLHALRMTRAADAPQTFTLSSKATTSLSFEGAGAAPHVRLIAPSGKVFDFTAATHGAIVESAYGGIIEAEDRTVVILADPEPGQWRAEVADGSTPIARIESADVLPQPGVKARVSGVGAKRTLRYDVRRIPGQKVTFVETAAGDHNVLGTVRGGGKGKFTYRLGDARSAKRTIEAEVSQDGIPRDRLEVARYVAANPRLATPKVRVRRKGAAARVSWSRVPTATRYDLRADYADGRRMLFAPEGGATHFTVPSVGAHGGLRVSVIAYTAAGRQSRPGTAQLGGRKRHKAKHHRRKHRHHGRRGK